jgi:hypothetical protein
MKEMAIQGIDSTYELVMNVSLRMVRGCVSVYEVLTSTADSEMSVRALPSPQNNAHNAPPTKRAPAFLAPVSAPATSLTKHSVMYAALPETLLYSNPTVTFDAYIARIPYGALVLMLDVQGRFCKVAWGNTEGWILKDNLADRSSRVYPEFVVGHENGPDHPNTLRVRACIDDEFGLGHSDFWLQAGEYIVYRLLRQSISIAWPPPRPRVPGSWHQLLRGLPGITMRVIPTAGSILEYADESEIGHLAYVEAVFPDGTIAISEANYPDRGIYNERALSKSEWQSLKPIFISVRNTTS